MSRAGATYYYHTNAHGDVVAVTNAAGEVANTYRYDPWGRVLEANETVPNAYRYASYRYDEATGLYYLWNRWYDAASMRFMTKDPYPGEVARPATANSYACCSDNPIMYADPVGLLFGGDAGEGYGQQALDYWADKYVGTDNPFAKALYALMGGLAALWTPGTSDATALVLGAALMAAPYAAAMGPVIGGNADKCSTAPGVAGQITRYTEYALGRMAGSRGDVGMARWAVAYTVRNPRFVEWQENGRLLYESEYGTVILEQDGTVMNVIPTAGSIAGYGSSPPW